MALSYFFPGASNIKIGRKSTFQHVEGNVNNNYVTCTGRQEQWEGDQVMPKQNRFWEIFEGHVHYVGESTWSQEMDIVLPKASKENESLKNSTATRVKVMKRFYTATIHPDKNYKVTVVTLEAENRRDKNTTRLLWEKLYQAYSAHRSPWLPQMLGVVRSEMPTCILHEELANGYEFQGRYPYGAVYQYLLYTLQVAVQTLRADKALPFPVSRWLEDWTFNPKTKSWLYDIASASTSEWVDESVSLSPIPFPQGKQPHRLEADDIATYFEETFGDVLYLYASFGKRWTECLSPYVSHNLLAFGAAVKAQSGILAHFASTPTPQWHLESHSQNINASYSDKVSSRVDFKFHNTRNTRLSLYFSLRLPLNERNHLRVAYFSQHPSNAGADTYFIDEIGFSLVGNLSHTLITSTSPVYLFVPPLGAECINGMYCLHYPLPTSLFYWAYDREGKDVIPKSSWGRYGIPKLELQTLVGSYWWGHEYSMVRQHIFRKTNIWDGKRYAQDHGYPELILGDPWHDIKIESLEDSDRDEPYRPISQLKSPSDSAISSIVDTPTDSDCAGGEEWAIITQLNLGMNSITNTSCGLEPEKSRAGFQTPPEFNSIRTDLDADWVLVSNP
ncbi:hypothetical protein PQX77_021781 [Marasmius sp. AFHP31]|nr:hypothetical protein PQX77_021781 [Marasmius sp. AFHP31]